MKIRIMGTISLFETAYILIKPSTCTGILVSDML